jgi:hypothetical protein
MRKTPLHDASSPDTVLSPVSATASPRPMTEERFLAGFVAALRAEGQEFIDTHGDAHHRRFDEVISALRIDRESGSPGAVSLPRTLVPTQMTGRYRELDDALLNMQRGYLSAPNPFYPGIRLKLSKSRANQILDSFTPEQREELQSLARIFRGNST